MGLYIYRNILNIFNDLGIWYLLISPTSQGEMVMHKSETKDLTLEQVEQKLSEIEKYITRPTPYGCTGQSFYGIEIAWQSLPLKRGGNIKRGKTWGVIKYFDVIMGYPLYSLGEHKELTRAEAVKELLRPYNERKAFADIKNMITCASCGTHAILEEIKERWGKLNYHVGGDKWNRKWIDICPNCINKLLNKETYNEKE
jgi:CRISPR/Cas system-associated protein Cas10 (large subunit of type III CRISPR-Cas system)